MRQRRTFLKSFGIISLSGVLWHLLGNVFHKVWAGEPKVVLPRDTNRLELAYNNPADLDTRNLEVTPLMDFRTMGSSRFKVDPEAWRLEVSGMVRQPLSLTYSQVLELASQERQVLLVCPGEFANHGSWKGIMMKELLEKAGVRGGATRLVFKSPEGDHASREQFTLEEVLAEKVFLAYRVNGEVLPEKHGFPLRVVAEGHFGSKWIKYVCCATVE